MSEAFWNDLNADLADPDFRAAYLRESVRIATIDRVVNELDRARMELGMSKAGLARAIGSHPAAMRRLFSAHGNPTIGTLSEVAAVLGLEVSLRPMSTYERSAMSSALAAAGAKAHD